MDFQMKLEEGQEIKSAITLFYTYSSYQPDWELCTIYCEWRRQVARRVASHGKTAWRLTLILWQYKWQDIKVNSRINKILFLHTLTHTQILLLAWYEEVVSKGFMTLDWWFCGEVIFIFLVWQIRRNTIFIKDN